MIADSQEVWVLEIAGRYWVAKRIVKGVYHEGNLYSLETDWDECHPDLINHAIEMGWCNPKRDFNFAKTYSDYINFPIDKSMIRFRRGKQLIKSTKAALNRS